jgi:hypothetical protein
MLQIRFSSLLDEEGEEDEVLNQMVVVTEMEEMVALEEV